MELSHGDQTESSAAGGFLPANTHHPLTFPPSHRSLSLYYPWRRGEFTLLRYYGLGAFRGDSEHQNNNGLSPRLSFALFTHNRFLFCALMREGQSVACALERQSLAALCLSGMFTQPCTQSHHSALTPGCFLALSHWTAVVDCFSSRGSTDLRLTEGREGQGQTVQGE